LNKLKYTRLLIAYYRIVFCLIHYFTAAQKNSDSKQTYWMAKETAHQIGTPLSSHRMGRNLEWKMLMNQQRLRLKRYWAIKLLQTVSKNWLRNPY
jgi:hypothetical protein